MEKLIHGKKSQVNKILACVTALSLATLVFFMNTKVAFAEDYSVTWYSASENPVSGSFVSATKYGESIDSAYEYTLGKYGYVDYLLSYKVIYNFTGFITGYSYKYRPFGQLLLRLPVTPNLTGFVYDQIFIDSFSWNGVVSDIEVTSSVNSSLAINHRPVNLYFRFDWIEVAGSSVSVDLNFRVRLYCNESNAVNLYTLGQTTISSQLLADQPNFNPSFTQVGAWIANFNMMQGSASQFNNSALMAGYLYDIREALAPSSPPDPAVQELETAVDNYEEKSSEEDALYESISGDIDLDSIDDAFDQVDGIFDGGLLQGITWWKRWLDDHYDVGVYNGEHYGSFIQMITNMIARLWH